MRAIPAHIEDPRFVGQLHRMRAGETDVAVEVLVQLPPRDEGCPGLNPFIMRAVSRPCELAVDKAFAVGAATTSSLSGEV